MGKKAGRIYFCITDTSRLFAMRKTITPFVWNAVIIPLFKGKGTFQKTKNERLKAFRVMGDK